MFYTESTFESRRLHELDSMRAIAALGVICWHYVNAFGAAPLGDVLAPFYGRGLLMVDFFFVLSGFVLAPAFWNERRAPEFSRNVQARFARMYPLHALTLCCVALLQFYLVVVLAEPSFVYAHNDAYHFSLNALLLNGSGLQSGFSFNAPSWSISTEFIVNLGFLALLVLPRRFACVGLCCIGVIAVSTMATRGMINGTKAFGVIDNDLVRTAAGFLVGVGAALVRSRKRWALPPWANDAVVVAVAVACWTYLASATLWCNLGDMVVCFVAFPALILAVTSGGVARRLLRVRGLVYLGEISYSIYLVHFPLQLLVHIAGVRSGSVPPFDSPWFFATFMACVVAVAALTHHFVELPGKRGLMRRKAALA